MSQYPLDMTTIEFRDLYKTMFDSAEPVFQPGRRNSDLVNWYLSRQLIGEERLESNPLGVLEEELQERFDNAEYASFFKNFENAKMIKRTLDYCSAYYFGLDVYDARDISVQVAY